MVKTLRSQNRKNLCKKRMLFSNGKNRHIFRRIKRRRFISLGRKRLSAIKKQIKKVIEEPTKKNEKMIVDNSVINEIIKKMKLVQL